MSGIGEAFSKFGKTIVDGTQKTAKQVSLAAEIDSLETKVKKLYLELGDKYYSIFGESPAEELVPYCDEIRRAKNDIAEKKKTMSELSGKKTCPYCGAPIDTTTIFCSACGKKVTGEEAAAQAPARLCPKCGAETAEGAAYCNHCGEKL
jgi:DNA-directed RNA polymerase subunit RPC12/RpoP